jgi:PA26 p53-induced protein (sestrin)
VNKLLTIPLKTFLKKVACYPEAVTLRDWSTFTQTFAVDEKVHIVSFNVIRSYMLKKKKKNQTFFLIHFFFKVLLVSEARRQAALLHALRAVLRCITDVPS